ncbi:hypothetical protein D3C78_1111180 [compost metagenome]
MELPGASTAPASKWVLPTEPEPRRRAPSPSVTVPPNWPLAARVPPRTCMRPVKPRPSPVKNKVPWPDLIKAPLPESGLTSVPSLDWASSREALLTIEPVPKLVTLPTRVPASMVVPPP